MKRHYFLGVIPILVILFSFSENSSAPAFGSRALDSTSTTDSILRFWLESQIVNSEKPISKTFYFWTTTDELDSVVSQKRLLRKASPGCHLEEVYWQKLFGTIKDNEPIANVLRSGDKQRVREAWPTYWSTLTELYPQSGQNQLVKVVLMDSSLIVIFNADERKEKWKVLDLYGKIVPMSTALARKQHIAAVFITGKNKGNWDNANQVNSMTTPTYIKKKEYYRTFLLCNEDMIKSWHHGVPGMQAKILDDLNYLLLLHAFLGERFHQQLQGRKGSNVRFSWVKPAAKLKVSQLFFATQRICWQGGVPATQQTITNIIELLRERWPKQVKPVERFPAAQKAQ